MRFPKPSKKARQASKLARRATRRDALAEIIAACVRRGQCRCEAPDCRKAGVRLELDHWLGGVGRRRQRESVETCWMLCTACHFERTRNYPSAEFWNDRFAEHCRAHGYQPIAHREHTGARRAEEGS